MEEGDGAGEEDGLWEVGTAPGVVGEGEGGLQVGDMDLGVGIAGLGEQGVGG